MEIWKDVVGHEQYYQVSSHGRVRSKRRNIIYPGGHLRIYESKVLKPIKTKAGYMQVNLSVNRKRLSENIHRLVAKAFIPEIEGKEHINHKDADKSNNHVENIEWCNPKENVDHAIEKGLWNPKGENNSFSKLDDEKVREIRKLSDLGYTNKKISDIFDVSPTTIGMVVLRKRWKHVDE